MWIYKHWLLPQWGVRSTISWANFKLQLRKVGLCHWAFLSLPLLWFKPNLSKSTGSVTWSSQLCPVSCSCPLPSQLSLRFAQTMKPILVLSSSKHFKMTWAGTASVCPPPNQGTDPAEKKLLFLLKLYYLLTGTVPCSDSPQCWRSGCAGTEKGTLRRAEDRKKCLIEGRNASFRETACLRCWWSFRLLYFTQLIVVITLELLWNINSVKNTPKVYMLQAVKAPLVNFLIFFLI